MAQRWQVLSTLDRNSLRLMEKGKQGLVRFLHPKIIADSCSLIWKLISDAVGKREILVKPLMLTQLRLG